MKAHWKPVGANAMILCLAFFAIAMISFYSGLNLYHRIHTWYYRLRTEASRPDVRIVRAKDGYAGRFPDIALTEDGLLVAYYWNTIHAPNKIGDSVGEIRMVRGTKDGLQWDEPQTLVSENELIRWGLALWADEEGNAYRNKEEAEQSGEARFVVDVRDPNLTVLKDGTLVCTFFTRIPSDSSPSFYSTGRTYMMYSRDNGKTWDGLTEIPCAYLDAGCAKRGNIAEYPDGTILIPLYGFHSELGSVATTANVRAALKDDGKWEFLEEYSQCTFQNNTPGAFQLGDTEVSFAVCGERTYALCRKSGLFLLSENQGASWRILNVNSGDFGTMQPGFCALRDGNRLFATWTEWRPNQSRSVYGKLYSVHGEWQDFQTELLFEDIYGLDMGDPSSVELPNGDLLTIFYDVGGGFIGGVFSLPDK